MATNFLTCSTVSQTAEEAPLNEQARLTAELDNPDAQPLLCAIDRAWERSKRNLGNRVGEVLLQCERFEWLADELRDDLSQTHSITAALVLADPDSRVSDIERALVSLALKATADSGLLLDAYQPPAYPERLALLHQIVRIEWENRYTGRVAS